MKKIIDVLKEFRPEYKFEEVDDFISEGTFDSVDLQEFYGVLETEYNIELAGTDLLPQNYRNIESIRDLLESRGVKFED